jgi:tetratricopeptide (TPR) repeat protein
MRPHRIDTGRPSQASLENPVTASPADVNLKLILASGLLDADPAAAARAAGEILGSDPRNTSASLLLATAARGLGDATLALQLLEELARSQPSIAFIRLELARAYRSAGRHEDSLAALRKTLELEPALADGWRELSLQLAAGGDDHGADKAYARYESLASDPWQLSEAAAALAENRIAAAEGLLRQILRHAPQDVAALRMLAETLARRSAYIESERLLRECLDLAPGYAAARYDLARLLLLRQKPTHLLPLIERLLLLDPKNADYRNVQWSAFSLLGQHDKSIAILGARLAETAGDASLWLNYGHELKSAGRSQQSIDAYRRSIVLAPPNGAAYWSLANLKTFRFDAADIDAMRAALERDHLRPEERVEFEFALAKALEDERRFAESFQHYADGNSLRRTAYGKDAADISLHVRRSQEIFTPQFFAARAGFGSQAQDPIFIVGMPRAGSTLLEQILASHSRVEGTRELADMLSIAVELSDSNGQTDPSAFFDAVGRLQAEEVRALADGYLEDTRIYRRGGEPRFVDKMPNNFLYVGLIHLMFPRAAIIDARRHPMGCGFSCFKQNFAHGYVFTYDQRELGHYYRNYAQLMAHYDAVLPGRVHRVHHERVVSDLPGELQRLLAYCELPFEEQCLRFYENSRGVASASAEQVRRPIFADGLDQWRHFEPWLGPLKEALGEVVERYPKT